MMGSESSEQLVESSDGSECAVEVAGLASTVERLMRNLHLEITRLSQSLEEARSENEDLQCLTEKQPQRVMESTTYIKELETMERVLTHNVEESLKEIIETEEEMARWSVACELEVEAGNIGIEDRDKVIASLKQELGETKSALEISNGKLKLKEELGSAAIAAQAAAERSLQLADSRATGLRERIEVLTRQLEETERRERNSCRKLRHICWPWLALKMKLVNGPNTRVRNVRQMMPEMQALLHHTL